MVQWIIAYLAFAWLTVQVIELLGDIFFWSAALLQGLVWTLVFGFLAMLVLAWFHGEKGQQRISAPELMMLSSISLTAALFLMLYDFEVPSPGKAAPQLTTSQFTNMATHRLTGSSGYEGNPAWSPDGRSVVFSSTRSGNTDLWIRDLQGETRQFTKDAAEDSQPAWSPDGRHILFVSSRGVGETVDHSVFFGYSLGGNLWKMPVLGDTPTMLIEDAYNPSWSPDGSGFAYDSSASGQRRIWIADAQGEQRRELTRDESDLAAHTRPAWSPDGKWVVYERQSGSQSRASELWLISPQDETSIRLTADQGRHFSPAWASSDSIVFASDRGGAINLWQMDIDPDSGEPLAAPAQITRGGGEDTDPAVSVGGKLVYVSQQRLFNTWKVGVDPVKWALVSEPESIFDTVWNDYAPALSADGTRLAFVSDREGEDDVWKLDPGQGQPQRLTDGPGQKLQPVWSPDGRLLAYFSNQAGNNDIWVVPSDGGAPVQLTNSPADDINPYWSPDGSLLAFVSDRSGQSEVWVMNTDGGDARMLTNISVTGHTARWSPDGQWILFTSMHTGDREIWAVSHEGGEPRRLTELPSQDAHGLWSPDGSRILYLSDHHVKWVQAFDGGERIKLFEPGERIDYTHLSEDGKTLLFTREKVEGDLWLMGSPRPE